MIVSQIHPRPILIYLNVILPSLQSSKWPFGTKFTKGESNSCIT